MQVRSMLLLGEKMLFPDLHFYLPGIPHGVDKGNDIDIANCYCVYVNVVLVFIFARASTT